MKTSVQLYMWTIMEAMKDERKMAMSEKYKEETLLISEDELYID